MNNKTWTLLCIGIGLIILGIGIYFKCSDCTTFRGWSVPKGFYTREVCSFNLRNLIY